MNIAIKNQGGEVRAGNVGQSSSLTVRGASLPRLAPPERGVHVASACEPKRALAVRDLIAVRTAKQPAGGHLVSPNGADSYQPRAERRAALGLTGRRNIALKGRATDGVGRGTGSPLQGLDASSISTQGDAPLPLN